MTDTLKVLGQADPLATTLTDLYTVPAVTQAAISSLTVCNRTGATQTFRVTVAPAGAADTAKHYLYYDLPIAPNDTFIATVGITLGATDKVRCYASAQALSFNLFGTEVT